MKCKRHMVSVVAVIFVLLFISAAYGSTRIAVAKWFPDNECLCVMGVCGERCNATIAVVDAATGNTLGYASTDKCGVWKVKLPCKTKPERILAVSNDEMSKVKKVCVSKECKAN